MRLLVVDDNEQNRYLLQALLTGHGHEVMVAAEGAEALEKAQANPPDMIITDILMPGMDGYALCREWKRHEKLKGIPFVFYTATYTDPKDQDFALSLGAERFIIKPQEPDVLVEMLEQVIAETQAGRQTQPPQPGLEDTVYFTKYNEALVRKLEDKLVQLESTKTALEGEIAERTRTEVALRRSEKELKTRVRISASFHTVPDDEVYAQVMEIILDALDSEIGAFGYIDENEALVFPSMTRDVWDKCDVPDKNIVFPPETWGASIWARSMREKRMLYSNERCKGTPEGHVPIERVVSVPLVNQGEVIGLVMAANKKTDYTREDIHLLESIGNAISPILNARLQRDQQHEKSVVLEGRLRQAQKIEAIGTLAGGIAHDFNNVLGAIIGYSQMAVDVLPPKSEAREDLALVLDAANRATGLVRQILTFSRQGEAERRPIRIHLVVKEALKLLRPSLPMTIEIQEDIDPACRPVLADATQMHQVIMNLSTNAYHAMRERGGVLAVALKPFVVDRTLARSRPDFHEGLYVRLTVSDTGHGIPKQILERIFDPFFTTKEQGEGTGLGLATTHGIVAAHAGAISVYSEPGKGTTFQVYLPCIEDHVTEKALDEAPIRGGKERILVVDDEPQLAGLTEKALKRFGYDIVAMTSSVDALAAFRAHPDLFDLIITDQTMPKMTGQQLADEVHAIRPEMPIIITTGFSEGLSAEKAEELGFRALLMKPANTRDIAKLVRDVLDGKEVSRA